MGYPYDPRWAQQPTYQQWQAPPPPQTTNGTAIAALICAFLFPILGIILGHVARSQIKRTGEGGGGMATAALILGYIFTLVPLTIIFFVVAGLIAIGENEHEQQQFPTVTDTGTAPGYSYQLPSQSPFPGSERPVAVTIQISDRLSISG